MRVSRKLILVAGVVVAAGSSAVAVAATHSGSSTNDPPPFAARADHRGGPGGPGASGWAGGPGRRHGPRLDQDTRGVVDAIRKAVAARAVAVGGPIVDQAVTDGDLTQDQADTAKQALADIQAGKRPSAAALGLLRGEKVRAVAQKIVKAVAPDVPGIAAPILDQAIKDGTLTQAEAGAIGQRIHAIADRAASGRLGRVGPAPRPGRHGFDRRDAGVLRDVWHAVLRQAPAVAGPIVDQAVTDGTITQAQGDQLKTAAADAAKHGRPRLAGHRHLMRDADVRAVVRDVVRALAKQAPTIGGPVIDRAVKDGTLTEEQGDRAKQRLADMAKRAGG